MHKKYHEQYDKQLNQNLTAGMMINYKRITLVHKQKKERLTIDLDCTFVNDNKEFTLGNCVIMESKSETKHSDSKYLLKEHGIKTVGSCSKYCLGNIILNGVKFNRFKSLMKTV